MPSFIEEFGNYLKAGFGGLTVKTVEAFDLVELLESKQEEYKYVLLLFAPGVPLTVVTGRSVVDEKLGQVQQVVSGQAVWQDLVLRKIRQAEPSTGVGPDLVKHTNQLQRLNAYLLDQYGEQSNQEIMADGGIHFVVLFQNVLSPELAKNQAMIQYLQSGAYAGKSSGVTYVIHSFDGQVGPQLEPYYPVLDFKLPEQSECINIIQPVLSDGAELWDEQPVAEAELLEIARATKGLTRRQIEDTTALLVRKRQHRDPTAYKQLKISVAEQNGLFKVVPVDKNKDKLFGLDGLVDFASPLLKHGSTTNKDIRPKGLLFVGPPGSGKTAASSLLAETSNRTLCQVDLGSLRSKWVGETESRVDRMFEMVESLAPAMLLVDEVEKSLDGAQSSGETDGGLGSRVLGKFLTWAQDHEEDVLLVATANDITRITDNFPEMLRAERFDAMFMFDLPNPDARRQMWRYYMGKFGLDKPISSLLDELVSESDNWTGAEIRACCRLAAIREVSVKQQLSLVPNVYKVATDVVEGVRSHAAGRFIDADSGLVYSNKSQAQEKKIVRKRRVTHS
jgi:hypothetical protein